MAEREVRIAHTEALFRDVNERIAESAERFSARDAEFVCECADPACAERVPATLEQYEEVRSDGDAFPAQSWSRAPRGGAGREAAAQAVRVVEKFNAVVARTVRRLNPRAETA